MKTLWCVLQKPHYKLCAFVRGLREGANSRLIRPDASGEEEKV